MVYDLRSVLRVAQQRQGQPSAVILDGRTLQSTCESGPRAAGYEGHKCKKGSKVRMAVDTLGHLLAARVTPANERERAQVKNRATSGGPQPAEMERLLKEVRALVAIAPKEKSQ